jgi:hypothetical protein
LAPPGNGKKPVGLRADALRVERVRLAATRQGKRVATAFLDPPVQEKF